LPTFSELEKRSEPFVVRPTIPSGVKPAQKSLDLGNPDLVERSVPEMLAKFGEPLLDVVPSALVGVV
jgi:hypothetical protein